MVCLMPYDHEVSQSGGAHERCKGLRFRESERIVTLRHARWRGQSQPNNRFPKVPVRAGALVGRTSWRPGRRLPQGCAHTQSRRVHLTMVAARNKAVIDGMVATPPSRRRPLPVSRPMPNWAGCTPRSVKLIMERTARAYVNFTGVAACLSKASGRRAWSGGFSLTRGAAQPLRSSRLEKHYPL
jgi:hypothetical protein